MPPRRVITNIPEYQANPAEQLPILPGLQAIQQAREQGLPPPLPILPPPPLPEAPPLPLTEPPQLVEFPALQELQQQLRPLPQEEYKILEKELHGLAYNQAKLLELLTGVRDMSFYELSPETFARNRRTLDNLQRQLDQGYSRIRVIANLEPRLITQIDYPNLINAIDYGTFDRNIKFIRDLAEQFRVLLVTDPELNRTLLEGQFADMASPYFRGKPLRWINFITYAVALFGDDRMYYWLRDGILNGRQYTQDYIYENVDDRTLELRVRFDGLANGNYNSYCDLFNLPIIGDNEPNRPKLLHLHHEEDVLFDMFVRAIAPYVRPLKFIKNDAKPTGEHKYIYARTQGTEEQKLSMLKDEEKFSVLSVGADFRSDNGDITTTYWPLNKMGIARVYAYTNHPEHKTPLPGIDSDTWEDKIFTMTRIEILENKNFPTFWRPQDKNIGFFPLLFTGELDLRFLQILRRKDTEEFDGEQCVIFALREAGVEESKLQEIMSAFKEGSHMHCNTLHKIADEILKEPIQVRSYERNGFDENGVQKYKLAKPLKYGNFPGVTPKICLAKYLGHVFIDKKYTECTKYYINNYRTLCNKPEYKQRIRERQCKSDVPTYYNTLELVHKLFELGFFVEDSIMYTIKGSENRENEEIILTEESINNDQREYEYEAKEENKNGPYSLWCADFEADTRGKHRPLLCGLKSVGGKYKLYDRDDGDKTITHQLLQTIYDCNKRTGKRWAIVYFHNLKYDINLMLEDINIVKDLSKDNQLYYVEAKYYGMKIQFRDFAKIIADPLSKFAKMFDLPKHMKKQEAIAYNYYKLEDRCNKDTCRISIEEYGMYLKDDKERRILKENVESNIYTFEYKDGYFNPWIYYMYYLYFDCEVLCCGIEKMIMLLRELGMEMVEFYTIGGISIEYAKKLKAFDGVFEVKGNLRKFLHKAVYGGRVHVNEKYEKKLINGYVKDDNGHDMYKDLTEYMGITDLDGVSLYPSAMYRLGKEGAFPLGACKLIKDFDRDRERYDDYVVEIVIDDVCKYQQMPMICYRGKDLSLQYLNECPPESVVVDKITLEDYEKFHEIVYRVIRGVYWDEGHNNRIAGVIDILFKKRLEAKGNESKRTLYKLMMNSIYGKTIPKLNNVSSEVVPKTKWNYDAESDTCIEDKHYWSKYLFTHYNTIYDWIDINSTAYYVKRYCYDNSYDFAHIGAKILSMSKRIMNEVFDVANDYGVIIFYTDTDSMHLLKGQLPLLERKYMERYERALCDDNLLEHFHVDFKIEDCSLKAEKIVSMDAMFIDKKIYLDMLWGKYDEEHFVRGVHVKYKGVKRPWLMYHADKHYGGDILKMFMDIAGGKKMELDTTAGGTCVNFDLKLYKWSRTDKEVKREL